MAWTASPGRAGTTSGARSSRTGSATRPRARSPTAASSTAAPARGAWTITITYDYAWDFNHDNLFQRADRGRSPLDRVLRPESRRCRWRPSTSAGDATCIMWHEHSATLERFFGDAAAGTLPRYSWVEPKMLLGDLDDYHPPTDIRSAETFLAAVYEAVRTSPQWESTALVVMFDEHGGCYDHVPAAGDGEPALGRGAAHAARRGPGPRSPPARRRADRPARGGAREGLRLAAGDSGGHATQGAQSHFKRPRRSRSDRPRPGSASAPAWARSRLGARCGAPRRRGRQEVAGSGPRRRSTQTGVCSWPWPSGLSRIKRPRELAVGTGRRARAPWR